MHLASHSLLACIVYCIWTQRPPPAQVTPVISMQPNVQCCSYSRLHPTLRPLICRRQYGDAWHLLAYPWQPERAQIVADEFCREQGYLQAGTSRPFSLPAAMVMLVSGCWCRAEQQEVLPPPLLQSIPLQSGLLFVMTFRCFSAAP